MIGFKSNFPISAGVSAYCMLCVAVLGRSTGHFVLGGIGFRHGLGRHQAFFGQNNKHDRACIDKLCIVSRRAAGQFSQVGAQAIYASFLKALPKTLIQCGVYKYAHISRLRRHIFWRLVGHIELLI